MVSAVFILHWPDSEIKYLRCELLLHRIYYNDIYDPHAVVQRFHQLYTELDPHERTPFLFDHGMTYMMLWGENDVILMAAARANVNALLTVTFLHEVHDILVRYFELPTKKQDLEGQVIDRAEETPGLTREKIIDNHSLVFELLDECMDFGIVQLTDYNILKEYIKTTINRPSLSASGQDDQSETDSSADEEFRVKRRLAKTEKTRKKKDKNEKKSTHNLANKTDVLNDTQANFINSSIVRTQALAISWRPKGIFYAKNEIYIDIVEKCNFLYDLGTETIKNNDISGVCEVKSYLSGMPLCRLGLNERYISQLEYDSELEGSDSENEEEEELKQETPEIEGNLIKSESVDNFDVESQSSAKSKSPAPSDTKEEKRLKVPISNVSFHQCIELSSVYKKNLIHFTPPDDKFTLFSYNVAQLRRKEKKPLIMIEPLFKILKSEGKLQVLCSLKTAYKKRLRCKPLVVRIPISPNLFHLDGKGDGNLRYKAELGEALFEVDSSTLTWTLPDLPGSKLVVRLMAEFAITNAEKVKEEDISEAFYLLPKTTDLDAKEETTADELNKYYGVGGKSSSVFDDLQKNAKISTQHRDIMIDFSLPLLTYSGLRITYLSVQEDTLKYTCFPWVRYLTEVRSSSLSKHRGSQQGEYRFRLAPKCFNIVP